MKRAISMVVAIIAALCLLLSGTLAYVLTNQHRSAYLGVNTDGIFDLTLINNFKSYNKADWAKDEAVQNPVYIKSNPDTGEAYVDAFVAVQLKEYLSATTRGDWVLTQDHKRALFAIDENGDYLSYTDTVTANILNCEKYPAAAANDDAFAIINNTQAQADANAILGIHGKPKRAGNAAFTYGNRAALEAVLQNGAQPAASDECGATPIDGWKSVARQTNARNFVSLKTGNAVLLADWLADYQANPRNPALTGAFWILGNNGWAYWAQALKPNTRTSELIETVTLEKDATEITYYMHVDMLATSLDDIDMLHADAGMPQELINLLKPATKPELPA